MWVGPYRLLEQVGAGALGIVHRAVSPQGAALAVKVIARSSPERDARLQRELQTQAALGAKLGFVPLLDSGIDERYVFLVMPFYPGGTLADRLRKGPLPQADAEALARRLAAALAEAHAQGLIHRDLKPANILFDAQGRGFIADLGLAKAYGKADRLSTTGEMRGSIGYMSPEQARSAKHVGPPADVFAWGAVVFEAVSGRRAFDAAEPLEVLRQVEEEGAPPLLRLCPDTSPRLAHVVDQALSREPRDRPLDGASLLGMLEAELAPAPRQRGPLAVIAFVIAAAAGVVLQQTLRARSERPTQPRASALSSQAPSASQSATTQASPLTSPLISPLASAKDEAAGPRAQLSRLKELRATWPASSPLQIRGVWGDTRGRLPLPAAAFGWVDDDEVLGVAGREVWRWSAKDGSLRSRRKLGVSVSWGAAKSLDAPRGRLWLLNRSRLELWSLIDGERLASFSKRSYSRIAHAPEAGACAVANSREVAFYRQGESKPVWRTSLGVGSKPPQLAVLPGGEVVAGGKGLKVFDSKGVLTRTIELPAPIAEGPLAMDGSTLYFVDKPGTLQVWDLAAWQRSAAYEKALPLTRSGLKRHLSLSPHPFFGFSDRGLGRLQRLGEEEATQEVFGLTGVAARGERLLLSQGGSSRARVSVSGPKGPLWKVGPAVDGWLTPCAGGALSFGGGGVVRWSVSGEARVLPRSQGAEALLATPQGYYAVEGGKHLELWREGASAPEQRWESEQTGPIGGANLSLLAVLPSGSALGYSKRTLVSREGNTYVISGQKQELTVFGPGEAKRDLDWSGSPPIAGAPLIGERFGFVCKDRVLIRSLTSEAQKEQRFPEATPWVGLRGGGKGFLRLSRRGLEVWAWGARTPDLALPLPEGIEERAIPTSKAKSSLAPGRLVGTDSWAAACFQRRVLWWDLARGKSHVLPLEGVVTLCAVGSELWLGSARGELVVLAPR